MRTDKINSNLYYESTCVKQHSHSTYFIGFESHARVGKCASALCTIEYVEQRKNKVKGVIQQSNVTDGASKEKEAITGGLRSVCGLRNTIATRHHVMKKAGSGYLCRGIIAERQKRTKEMQKFQIAFTVALWRGVP